MYVERDLTEKFTKLLKIYNIISVIGARQSGKTTFLKEESKKYNCEYISFDDPDVVSLFEDIKKFEKQYFNTSKTVILDEIQYGKEPGIKLKYLVDKGHKIWITSSSGLLLEKKVLSYLVGRVGLLNMYPFSIKEFLGANKQYETTKLILSRSVWEHIKYGGYPKVILTNDNELKRILLKNLYELLILKDVARTFSISDIRSLEILSKYLALNTGNLISYENLSSDLSLSFETIKKYLDAFEKSYITIRISPFFTNKSKEIVKQPKLYFIDTGLRNAIANSFELSGQLFENYVLCELLKINLFPKFWRTKSKAEVDFIIENENKIIPIEVKLKSNKIEKSLQSFIKTYRPKQAFIVHYEGKDKILNINGCNVIFTDVIGLIESLSHEKKS